MQSPMLAVNMDPEKLEFPCLASYKLDGWRAVIKDGKVYTRSGGLVVNEHVQKLFGLDELEGLDGEIIVGPPNLNSTYNTTQTALKRVSGEPDAWFYVFDLYNQPLLPYCDRATMAQQRINGAQLDCPVAWLMQQEVNSMAELSEVEQLAVDSGYEGLVLRPVGVSDYYKYGRSTVNEGFLLKMKRMSHGEAKIVDFVEQLHNENEAFKNGVGRTKRQTIAENMTPTGMLASYTVESPEYKTSFNVSCGSMTHDEKRRRWENRAEDIDSLVRFKFFAHGTKDAPRQAIFAGFRSPEDMS